MNIKRKTVFFLKALTVYICVLYVFLALYIPSGINLYENKSAFVTFKCASFDKSGITLDGEKIIGEKAGNYKASITLMGIIPVKSIKISVTNEKKVVPCGKVVGVRLYSDGLVAVAIGTITDENGNRTSPAKEAGIKEGDIITHINGVRLMSASHLMAVLEKTSGDVSVTYKRNEKIYNAKVTPVISATDKSKKIGLWVRDSTAGIGTVTYYDKDDLSFGALGHPITDIDTGVSFSVLEASVVGCSVSVSKKGEKGSPGELYGSFSPTDKDIGTINLNSDCGIFGTLFEEISDREAVPVALKSDVKVGKAIVLSNISGDSVKEYEIEIVKVFKFLSSESKDMIIRVTDPNLLEAAGGIVQGMSGSPILQNGKLVGVVTHVFVNDPTRGYAIFAEKMLKRTNCGK